MTDDELKARLAKIGLGNDIDGFGDSERRITVGIISILEQAYANGFVTGWQQLAATQEKIFEAMFPKSKEPQP